jgi:Ca2+-binding RTX toxin-like protein
MAIESNDTISTATETGLNPSNLGTFTDSGSIGDNPNVSSSADVDLYKVELTAGNNLIINLDAIEIPPKPSGELNGYLRVFDSQGKEIAASQDPPDIDAFLNLTPSVSGIYYIGVSGVPNFNYDPFVEGSGGGKDGSYNLSITVVTPLVLRGTSGNDSLVGANGNDSISGVGGNDTIQGLLGNDTLRGDDGLDSILGGDGSDRINGGIGSDRLFGEGGDDFLNGSNDNDTIEGGSGNDTLLGGSGDDVLTSGENSSTASRGERLDGGDGNDTLTGSNGFPSDTLLGGNGNDSITGNLGSDVLKGGSGNDTLVSVLNSGDTLTGGLGSDRFILDDAIVTDFDSEFDAAVIKDFNVNEDKIQIQGAAENYFLDFFTRSGTTNAAITYDLGATTPEDIVAVLENVSSDLSLNNPAFVFI